MTEPTSRMEWRDDMVESLLYLRMNKYGELFKGTRSMAQLSATWTAIWIEFKAKNGVECSVDQLKNKFHALRSQFDRIRASESLTGNATEEPLIYPAYWDAMVIAFGLLSGMGNRDFGQTTADSVSGHIVSAQSKQASRKRKADLADAVAMMANAFAKRAETRPSTDHKGSSEVMESLASVEAHLTEALSSQSALLGEQAKIMEGMRKTMDESTQVNIALLRFLQSTQLAPTAPPSAEQTESP